MVCLKIQPDFLFDIRQDYRLLKRADSLEKPSYKLANSVLLKLLK